VIHRRELHEIFRLAGLETFESGATFSTDRRYRYRLWRCWGELDHRCVFVGLNPSTADESENDPTIRKCIGFAKRWGFGAIDVVNLFALVSTLPEGLLKADDPIGHANDATLNGAFQDARRIVWCWGQHDTRVRRLVKARLDASKGYCVPKRAETGSLGHSQDGSPRHPLRLAYAARFEQASRRLHSAKGE
jgi:hypothetical protein